MKGFFNPTEWQKGPKRAKRLPMCGKCGLYKKCISPKMPPTGRGKRKILFVAEAPGEKEDQKNVQLVGPAGQHLRKTLKRFKFDLDSAMKTNAIICRPPNNEIKDIFIECCRPNLTKTIEEHKPSVIILLGAAAVKSLIPTERDGKKTGGIKKWAGWKIPSHEHQAWICPTWHPSFILRMDSPVLERNFRKHLREAVRLENVPISKTYSLPELKKKVDVILSPSQAKAKLRDLSKKKGLVAFDYEATGLKPENPKQRIVSCSFCFEGNDTWAFMMKEEHAPLMRKVLRKRSLLKVAANAKFEERWTRRKLGTGVAGWHWDTMLAAHVLDNRGGIGSVKFQAYVYFGVANYDKAVEGFFESEGNNLNRIHEIPEKLLLTYNGMDSLLEFMIYERQRQEMSIHA